MKRPKGDVAYHLPKKKKPIAYSTKATSDLIKEICCLNAEKRKLERKISRLEKMVATDTNVGGKKEHSNVST